MRWIQAVVMRKSSVSMAYCGCCAGDDDSPGDCDDGGKSEIIEVDPAFVLVTMDMHLIVASGRNDW